MIRLKPEHQHWRQPTHPLIRNAKVRSEDEIVQACQHWLDTRTDMARANAVYVFSSCLRHIVGRWLGTFSITWDHEDDLVQVGYMSIIKSIDELEDTYDVMNLVTNRALAAQTAFINKARSVVAPSLTTQKERWAEDGEEVPESEEFDLEIGHDRPDPCNEILQVDFVDAVRLSCHDEIDLAIVQPENWNKPVREVAERVGVSPMTVSNRRRELIKRVQEELNRA